MPIIIEEEKSNSNIARILVWLAILIVSGSAIYYIFFTRPDIIDIATPQSLQNIDPLANIELNPEEVVNSSKFQSLKQYITPPAPVNYGRSNPFSTP